MSDARDLCVLTDVRAWLGLSGRPIQSISKAAQAVVGCSNHGAVVGNVVGFSLVGGMTEINNQTGTVVSVGDANTFTVSINSRELVGLVRNALAPMALAVMRS